MGIAYTTNGLTIPPTTLRQERMGCGASGASGEEPKSLQDKNDKSKCEPHLRKKEGPHLRKKTQAQVRCERLGLDDTTTTRAGAEHASGVAVAKPQNPLYKGDWEERMDKTSGNIFYLNHHTGEQTKQRPDEMNYKVELSQGLHNVGEDDRKDGNNHLARLHHKSKSGVGKSKSGIGAGSGAHGRAKTPHQVRLGSN